VIVLEKILVTKLNINADNENSSESYEGDNFISSSV